MVSIFKLSTRRGADMPYQTDETFLLNMLSASPDTLLTVDADYQCDPKLKTDQGAAEIQSHRQRVYRFFKIFRAVDDKIQSHFASEQDAVYADIAQINQLLINICINAVQVMTTKKGFLDIGLVNVTITVDEKDIVDAAKRLLTRLGYRVLTAQNAGDAIHVFKDQIHRIDLVITDMTMPDMTGIDLSKTFFSLKNDIPIILCTGYGSLMTLEKAEKTGFKEVILKPVSRKKLSDAIRKALDR